ncbi:hypothetical protein BDW67DRAFT_170306 [Aspergillus spinulosporus]
MVNVAVAGGTGGVGRTIVEVLSRSLHQAFVFSRKPLDGGISNNQNITTVTVDYTKVDSLVRILEIYKIHTVICTFSVSGDSLSRSQANLIEAAKLSKETKRFVPSSFAIQYPREAVKDLPQLRDYFAAIETLRQSNLEFTVFHNGIFLDYFISPKTTLKSYLRPNVFVIDIANKIAAIPGDGNAPVTLTYSFDLARFVVQSLDLKDGKWHEESRVVGDEISWNEFVGLAEEMLGCKFKVHYDPIEKLKNSEITELPGHRVLYNRFPKESFRWFMSIFELFTVDGGSRLEKQGSLNERFPEIIPFTVRDALRGWKDEVSR